MPSGHDGQRSDMDESSQRDAAKNKHNNVLDIFLSDKPIRTDPFGHNTMSRNAYERAERISSAIFLATNHIKDDDSLRENIRSVSLDFLVQSMSLRDDLRSSNSDSVREVQVLVRLLGSLTRLLTVSGRLSLPNARVLIGALEDFGALVTGAHRSVLSESFTFREHDFQPDIEKVQSDLARQRAATSSPRGLRKRSGVADLTSPSVPTSPRSVRSGSRDSRSERILAVLRMLGATGIREIASQLPEYSEKMIQRELAVMVQEGKVSKNGSKRWSKYAAL